MVFQFEEDDRRWEVRQSIAQTLIHWPKVDGIGNVLVSAIGGENTYTVFGDRGATLQNETNVSGTTVGGISQLRLSIPAIEDLDEDLYIVIKFTPDLSTHEANDNFERVYTRPFDVVLQPWGDSQISLNDLESRVPTIRARLKRQANAQDPTNVKTPEALASEWGHLAHAELYRRIRQRVRFDVTNRGIEYTRPRLIIDRAELHPVEVALAINMIFEGDLRDEGDEAMTLAGKWSEKFQSMYSQLGPLTYDLDEDRVVEEILPKHGSKRRRRRQAL